MARFQDDDDRFEIDAPDVDIIQALDADETYRWVLVSADTRITKRPAERAVLTAAGIKFFYCGRAWFKMSTHEQAWKFLRAWPKIVEIAEYHKGKVFEIEGANLKVTPVG
jgi:PIN like domain